MKFKPKKEAEYPAKDKQPRIHSKDKITKKQLWLKLIMSEFEIINLKLDLLKK